MSISSHIDESNKLIADLLHLDETFEDEHKALLLIGSPIDELDNLCIILIHGKEKLSFEEVCSALLNYEIRKKYQREHRDESVEALTVRERSQNKKWEKKGKGDIKEYIRKDKCAFFHEERHWKKDCPKLKNKYRGKSMSDACVECGGDYSDYEFCLVGHQTITGFDEWIFDSGCTYNMCSHKEWFFKFEEVDGGVVYMGSGDVSYITEMSSIWLNNHDGLIIVLIDIRNVPKLKKNIISLGAFESKGLVVIIRDGVLNVILDALLVMKGTRRNNLYYYNGSTMIGVVATISNSGEDLKITSLWHRCLGPVVGVVSRYRLDPGKRHSQEVKWVLQYLLKTVSVSLDFE